MTRVNILVSGQSEETRIFLTPLLVNRSMLKDMGITFRVVREYAGSLYDADCVFFENRVFRGWGRERQDEKAFELLEALRQRVDKVFWVDTTDGTGTTQFQVLPYVDVYLKTQILADKSGYTRPYYGGRIYTDYYHSEFGVTDTDDTFLVVPAKAADLSKIRLAWNDGLGDFGGWGHYVRRLSAYLPLPCFYSAKFSEIRQRSVDVSARFGVSYARETVAFQRQLAKTALDGIGVETDKLSRRAYMTELRNAKVAVSPFGWGEPSYRDYEVIINGAALVKPDVSHMTTWPDFYVAGETYSPFKWDCSDLADVIETTLEGDRWRRIAGQAQAFYRKYLFDRDGREEFCSRVRDLVLSTPSSTATTLESHEAIQ
jgi:hypothetical protein